MPTNVREALVSPIEEIGQLFMVEPQQSFVEQATLGQVGDYLASVTI